MYSTLTCFLKQIKEKEWERDFVWERKKYIVLLRNVQKEREHDLLPHTSSFIQRNDHLSRPNSARHDFIIQFPGLFHSGLFIHLYSKTKVDFPRWVHIRRTCECRTNWNWEQPADAHSPAQFYSIFKICRIRWVYRNVKTLDWYRCRVGWGL